MFGKSPKTFTLCYWQDDGYFVGKLQEVPGVFSQGETLKELLENIEEAYHLMLEEAESCIPVTDYQTTTIEFST